MAREGCDPRHVDPWSDTVGSGGWLLAVSVMILLFVAVVWLVAAVVRWHLASRTGGGREEPGPVSALGALRILDERLARGDVDSDEYQRRRSLLR